MEKTKVLIKGTNAGYNVKGNGLVYFNLLFDASQVVNVMNLFQLLGRPFKVYAKLEEEKVFLGTYSIHSLKVDNDAETKLCLRTNADDVKISEVARIHEQQTETIDYIMIGKPV